jgi:glutathione S-transferase
MGKIPAFADGDFKLWESNAINWYLAEKHPAARLLPDSPQARASVQRWLFFQSAHVSPACIPVFRATNPRIRAFFNVTLDEPAADKGRKELARFLPVLEQALSGRDWLEREFSLADVAYAPHLITVAGGGFDFTPYPGIRAWLDRLAARPAWRRVAETVYVD